MPEGAKGQKRPADVTAIAAGLAGSLMTIEDVVPLIDARAEKPNRPATYKSRLQISN